MHKHGYRSYLSAFVAALALAQAAQAQEPLPDSKFRFLAGVGYTSGGDTLVNISLTPKNGSGPTYYEDLSGGAGIDLRLGAEFRPSTTFRLQGMVAYHNDQANGVNAHASYRRVPVELLGHWRAGENWWLGGGIRKALYGTLDREAGFKSGGTTLPAEKWDIKFSTGLVLEAEYMMSKNWGLKMRAVKEKGRIEDETEKFSGDHVGAILTYYFD
ncbi:MAG: hypothetical protein ACM3VZ_10240 [Acidobacteriota bacterium]